MVFRLLFILLLFLVFLSWGCGSSFEGVVLENRGDVRSRALAILKEGLSDPDDRIRMNAIEVVAKTGQRPNSLSMEKKATPMALHS